MRCRYLRIVPSFPIAEDQQLSSNSTSFSIQASRDSAAAGQSRSLFSAAMGFGNACFGRGGQNWGRSTICLVYQPKDASTEGLLVWCHKNKKWSVSSYHAFAGIVEACPMQGRCLGQICKDQHKRGDASSVLPAPSKLFL